MHLPQQNKSEVTLNFIKCPVCDHKERITEMRCSQCGVVLSRRSPREHTQPLAENRVNVPGDAEYYDYRATLFLKVRGSDETYRVRPQDHRDYVVLGRLSNQQGTVDIDLSKSDGHLLGVSRRHLAIIYDRKNNVLNVTDLSSGNGTFINEQRLHPHEIRVLRQGDVLRLGKLELIATITQQQPPDDASS